MVDFQERDTRRGLGSREDEEAEDDETEGAEDDETEEEVGTGVEEVADAGAERDATADQDAGAGVAAGGEAGNAHDHRADGPGHGSDGHGHDDHSGHGDRDDTDHAHDAHDGHDDHAHDHHAHDVASVGVGVVTVSSSRSLSDDPAGDAIVAALEDADDRVVIRDLVRDDLDAIQGAVANLVGRGDVDAVVTTGGTGVTPDDVTVEAVEPLFEKELPGFGELFRLLSYDEIGTRVVATRAVAGIADGVPVFCLPGSENAARLGAEEIIAPEVGHLAGLAARDDDG